MCTKSNACCTLTGDGVNASQRAAVTTSFKLRTLTPWTQLCHSLLSIFHQIKTFTEPVLTPSHDISIPSVACDQPGASTHHKTNNGQWCGLRPSVLKQDRSETKTSGLGLARCGPGLASMVLCCENGLVMVVLTMIMMDTATFKCHS